MLEPYRLSQPCRVTLLSLQWGCSPHSFLASCTISRDFADPEAVKDWMIDNQLGKRNLSKDEFKLFLGMKYNRTKKTKAEAGAIGGVSKAQNGTCLPTAETIAQDHGISKNTVKRAGADVAALEETPELFEAVRNGEKTFKEARETSALMNSSCFWG